MGGFDRIIGQRNIVFGIQLRACDEGRAIIIIIIIIIIITIISLFIQKDRSAEIEGICWYKPVI